MNYKKTLAIIFILALFLRIIFALIVPIFEKPDEELYLGYIQFIVDNKRLPVQNEELSFTGFFQPPLYYILASLVLGLTKTFTNDVWHHILSIRILSVFISMLTLYFVYKTSSLVFRDRNLILGVTAFVSFLPSHINMNTTTNAGLGDLFSIMVIYFILKTIFVGENKKNIVLLGLSAGMGLITRLSIIPAILTLPFAFIVKHYPNIKRALKPILITAIIALAVSILFFIRNFMLYGDFLGLSAMTLNNPEDAIEKVDLTFIARLLGWTFVTFWASFGRTNGVFIGNLTSATGIIIFIVIYSLLLIITLASLYGLYRFFKKHWKNRNILSDNQKKAFIIMSFHLVPLVLLFIRYNLFDFQPQGRYLFPAISSIAIFFTLGIYSFLNVQNRKKFLTAYITGLLSLNVLSIISIIQFYG
jgi:hypothetical protein